MDDLVNQSNKPLQLMTDTQDLLTQSVKIIPQSDKNLTRKYNFQFQISDAIVILK